MYNCHFFQFYKQDCPLRTPCTCKYMYNLPWPYGLNPGELKSVDRCFTCASYEIKIATRTEKLESIQNLIP